MRPIQSLDKFHAVPSSIGMLHWRRWGFQRRIPSSITFIHNSVFRQEDRMAGRWTWLFRAFWGYSLENGGINRAEKKQGGKAPSSSVSGMGLEHPQPSRGANSPQIAGSNSNLKLALGLSQLEAAGICIALIKDSLSRHNETESEQPARCSAFPRGPPWVMFRGMIHIPHLGNLRSHGTGRELCPPGPSCRRQTGGLIPNLWQSCSFWVIWG